MSNTQSLGFLLVLPFRDLSRRFSPREREPSQKQVAIPVGNILHPVGNDAKSRANPALGAVYLKNEIWIRKEVKKKLQHFRTMLS